MKDKNSENLVAVDFFCSSGGVTCGFKAAGIEVLGGIDIDENCKETYEINNSAKFLKADVSTLPKGDLKKEFGIGVNQDNLIFVGCSPCQYYSNIKTDKSKSEKGRLLLEDFREFVEYYRPGFVFVENVPGLDTKEGSPLANFKSFLKKEGYFFDENILNAKYFGVAQNRRRYVLIASRIKKVSLPAPNKRDIKTVKQVIGNYDLLRPIGAGDADKVDKLHASANLNSTNLKRIQNTPKNGGDRRSWDKSLQPKCYDNHTGHYDVYGRMFWDKPSPTITTRFISYSNGRYGHPEQDRAISLREGAILQSFPIDYKFISNSQGVISRMIGNAVPPKMAEVIALQFLKND